MRELVENLWLPVSSLLLPLELFVEDRHQGKQA